MFNEFMGGSATPDDLVGFWRCEISLRCRGRNATLNNCKVSLSLAPNPSHLEAVNTVVLGKSTCQAGECK